MDLDEAVDRAAHVVARRAARRVGGHDRDHAAFGEQDREPRDRGERRSRFVGLQVHANAGLVLVEQDVRDAAFTELVGDEPPDGRLARIPAGRRG